MSDLARPQNLNLSKSERNDLPVRRESGVSLTSSVALDKHTKKKRKKNLIRNSSTGETVPLSAKADAKHSSTEGRSTVKRKIFKESAQKLDYKSQKVSWEEPRIVNGMVSVSAASLSSHLVCCICHGYYRDPHTIPECLHTFCKSCIVVLFYHGYRKCPTCKISLEPDPYQHLLSDRTVQELLTKLFPNLYDQDLLQEKLFMQSKLGPQVPTGVEMSTTNFNTDLQSWLLKEHDNPHAEAIIGEHANQAYSQDSQLATSTTKLSPQETDLRKKTVPPDELDFLLVPDNCTERHHTIPSLHNPLIRTSGRMKIIQLRKYVLRKLNLASSLKASAVEILCNGDPLGDELSLTFIHRTRWIDGDDQLLTLTFRLSEEGRL